MYKVGQKISIGYYGGFNNQTLIKTQAEVTKVYFGIVYIKMLSGKKDRAEILKKLLLHDKKRLTRVTSKCKIENGRGTAHGVPK